MASKPFQFVGYWGYGKLQEQQGIFSRLLTAVPVRGKTQTIASPADSDRVWGIGYIGDTYPPNFNGKGILASLSAAGLPNFPDAWVKVEGECLILGRSLFGRVPLYWIQIDRVIWFASQVRLLLPLIAVPEVSISGLYGYSCFSYIPTPLTPVVGISAVPAGTEKIWQPSVREFKPVDRQLHKWQSQTPLIADESEAIEQLQTLLKNAIERQLEGLAHEPVGVFLSGGLDSSIVAALLVRSGVKVRAYTLDFGASGIPELPYAERVADFLNIPLVKVETTPRRIKKAIASTAAALDLPFGDGVTVPLYLLCQAASQETEVIFNGENGDQLFAGWTNKPLIAAGIYNTQEDFIEQYLRTFHRLYGYEDKVFQPEVYDRIHSLNPREWLKDALDPSFTTNLLDRLRRANLMLKGAQNIQPRATNLAFDCGLWVRSPFCDLPLTAWTFAIPGELFLRGSTEKYILKRAVESWLPPEIVWREKRGMGVPLTQWCFNQLWTSLDNWLNPGILRSEGRWITDLAMQVIMGQLGGQLVGRRIGEILWLLIMWQAWRTAVLGEAIEGKSLINEFWLPYSWQRRFRSQLW